MALRFSNMKFRTMLVGIACSILMSCHHPKQSSMAGWRLLAPPLIVDANNASIKEDTGAALSLWKTVRIFATRQECETNRAQTSVFDATKLCVPADDPRLKK
jgi:hypothetical protein